MALPDWGDKLASQINKRWGDGTAVVASSSSSRKLEAIPTGVFAIDVAIGIGGIPRGRISQFIGKPSSCKTGVALKVVRSAQEMCRECFTTMPTTGEMLNRCRACGSTSAKSKKCASQTCENALMELEAWPARQCLTHGYMPMRVSWCDTEGVWDNAWAAGIGVNCDYVLISQPDAGETAVEVVDMSLRSGDADLVVLDSFAHLTPTAEIDGGADKMLMGTQARLSNKAMRKWVSSLNAMHRLPTLLVINQIRMKIGVMYGDPETTPGGMGKEFASSLDIRMRRGKYHFVSAKGTDITTTDGSAAPIYADIHFLVKKNKVGAPGKGGEFRFYLSNYEGRSIGDSDDGETIWAFAKKYGLVVSGDGKWTCGDLEAKTWKELKAMILVPVNQNRVRAELVAIMARK